MTAEFAAAWLGIVLALVVVGWAITPIEREKQLDANPLRRALYWARGLKRGHGADE